MKTYFLSILIIGLILISSSANATTYDIGASSKRATDYMESTLKPVIQKGAEWGATAGLAFSGLTAFVTVIKKFLE